MNQKRGVLTALDARVQAWVRLTRWPVRRVFQKQLLFSGVQAAAIVLLVGILSGAIICNELHYHFGQSGQASLRLLAEIGLQELAPLLTALILVSRSASAMASELVTMQVNGEIRHLQMLGVGVGEYLIAPRIAGMLSASMILVVYFSAGMLFCGAAVTSGFGLMHDLEQLTASLPIMLVMGCVLKAAVLGGVIASMACREGLRPASSFNDIPKASSRSVIKSLATVFVADAVLVWLK